MNERIQKLAEEADLYARSDNSSMLFENYQKRYTEKFAELIVRECANITLDYKNHDHYTGWLDHGEEIARHFGVER